MPYVPHSPADVRAMLDVLGKSSVDELFAHLPANVRLNRPLDLPDGLTEEEVRRYFRGVAGERFAVRNSGAVAIVEGAGDHCCEYMTGGIVAVLGRTGLNFGARFTGGFAYILDLERDFVDRYNHELIDIQRVSPEGMEHHLQHLRGLIGAHVRETGSRWGQSLLDEFRDYLPKFWLAKPKAASMDSLVESLKRAA